MFGVGCVDIPARPRRGGELRIGLLGGGVPLRLAAKGDERKRDAKEGLVDFCLRLKDILHYVSLVPVLTTIHHTLHPALRLHATDHLLAAHGRQCRVHYRRHRRRSAACGWTKLRRAHGTSD